MKSTRMVGVLLLLAGIALALTRDGQPARFWTAYFSFGLFFMTLSLGAFFLVALQHVCRAGWSVLLRRPLEHIAGAVPGLSLALLPLAAGLSVLYPWLWNPDPGWSPFKQVYLAPFAFQSRALLYLMGWSLGAWWLRRQSLLQDQRRQSAISGRVRSGSAALLVWFAFSLTLAVFDWLMALNPAWYSTIFGVYLFAGCCCGALALWLLSTLAMGSIVSADHLHQLGKLQFGFSAFWAYIAFSQFLVIWYADIPEETIWYADRIAEGWLWLAIAVVATRFLLPFVLLLPRRNKRRRGVLATAAIISLAGHLLDLYWLIAPAFQSSFSPRLVEGALGLAWLGYFLVIVAGLGRRSSPIPLGDPRLQESLAWSEV
ncbi:MAG: hypothetical protein ACE5ID_11935 [Acidobacteriota bacterium]